VPGSERDLVVDTGCGVGALAGLVASLQARPRPKLAVVTHHHIDHAGGAHEFRERLAHPLAARRLANGSKLHPLLTTTWPPNVLDVLDAGGWDLPDVMVDALPHPGFDPAAYRLAPAPPTRLVDEGDRIDLGDRTLTVLHLPGHTSDSVGLYDEHLGELFTGDVAYEGRLLDELDDSSVQAYVDTMRRLSGLPVSVVYPGHGQPFDGRRLQQIVVGYLRARGAA
jgi:glyoxylase-like metal-dependent hydrolase (beta-lactamase superfamily II)